MSKLLKNPLALLSIGLFIALVLLVVPSLQIGQSSTSQGAPAPRDDNRLAATLGESCDITHTLVPIQADQSTIILATTTSPNIRAWAMIQQPESATTTASLNLTGEVAISGQGLLLHPATTTTGSLFSFEFGVDIDRPIINAISGITDTSTSTLRVTECLYS